MIAVHLRSHRHNYAHIGNFRTFTFEDVLRRWLEASGSTLSRHEPHAVDDKMIKGAHARGISIAELAIPFIEAFHADASSCDPAGA